MGKKILYTTLFAGFAAMLGLGIVSPLMPIFEKNLNANGFWLGMIFTGFLISRAIVMPVAGNLSDKIGRKIIITSGLLLYAAISLCYPLAKNVYSLTAVRLIHGLASGMIIPVVMAYAGMIVKKGQEGRTMGMLNMILYLGMGSGPFLAGLLNDKFGFSSSFYVMSAIAALAFIIGIFSLPAAKKEEVKAGLEKDMPFRTLIKYNLIKALLLISVVITFRGGIVMSFLPTLAERIKIDASQVGIIIALSIFLAGLLQSPFGKMADSFKNYYHKLYLILIGSVVGIIALLVMPSCSSFITLLIASAFIGVGAAISTPAAAAISVLIGQKAGMGSWMGIFNTAMSIGFIIAPLLSGVIMDNLGINAVFYIGAGISILGTSFCYYFIWRRIKGYKTG